MGSSLKFSQVSLAIGRILLMRGAYKGRKKVLSVQDVATLKKRIAEGETKAKVARDLGLSRETLYQYLRQS